VNAPLIAVVLSLIIVTVISLYAEPAPKPRPMPMPCFDQAAREDLRTISQSALDEAYRSHVASLYTSWMKDAHGQPERARNGVDLGIRAYQRAKQDIESWSPPLC